MDIQAFGGFHGHSGLIQVVGRGGLRRRGRCRGRPSGAAAHPAGLAAHPAGRPVDGERRVEELLAVAVVGRGRGCRERFVTSCSAALEPR